MYAWLLPEAIEDLLPHQAAQVEALRRLLLDEFSCHGYQLVVPPLLEFADALRSSHDSDLDVRSFKLVDQLSGKTLAVRADITPQVARIDAHLLNRQGVARLSYCGSVLHALPADLLASREPLQLGAELYGHAGLEADHEIIRLLARALQLAELPPSRIDLSHIAIFRALIEELQLSEPVERAIFDALQTKDSAGLAELTLDFPQALRDGLRALPDLYGDKTILDQAAKRLPAMPAISQALADMQRLATELVDLPLSFDLADLRSYQYHSGLMFAAYCSGNPAALALGGRYDASGERFGRSRAATGFSLDLRLLARLSAPRSTPGAILAPWSDDTQLSQEIARLRASGETVVLALPGHDDWSESGCDRQLVWQQERWMIKTIEGR